MVGRKPRKNKNEEVQEEVPETTEAAEEPTTFVEDPQVAEEAGQPAEEPGEPQQYHEEQAHDSRQNDFEEHAHSERSQQYRQQEYRPRDQNYTRSRANNTLAVFGLPLHTEEHELREVFSPFGDISELRMIRDHQTDAFRGFAFVTYYDVNTASKALDALEGTEIGGSPIRLDFSRPARRRGGMERGRAPAFRDNDRRYDRNTYRNSYRDSYRNSYRDSYNDYGYGKRSKNEGAQRWDEDGGRNSRGRRYNDDGNRYRRY